MNSTTNNERMNRRARRRKTAIALLIGAVLLMSQSVWAGGSFGLKVQNISSDEWIYIVTGDRECMSSYTDDTTMPPGDIEYLKGTSDSGSSVLSSCAYEDSKIRYSF